MCLKSLLIKFLIRVSIPNAQGNEMVKDPNFLKNIKDYIKRTNVESAYFTVYEGDRTAIFIIDVISAEQMLKDCEPLFILGGKVHWNMVMTLDDLKKGL